MRLFTAGIVLGLVLALAGVALADIAGYVNMAKFRASPESFRDGYVAGASDMVDAVISRADRPDTAQRMLCLKRFTDTKKIGELSEWVFRLQQNPTVQTADAMLVEAPCSNI